MVRSIQLIPDSQSLSWFIILHGLPPRAAALYGNNEPFVYAHSLFDPPRISHIPSTTSVCKNYAFLIFQSFSVPFPSNSPYIALNFIRIGSIRGRSLVRLQLTNQDRYAVYSYFNLNLAFRDRSFKLLFFNYPFHSSFLSQTSLDLYPNERRHQDPFVAV